MSLYLYLFHGRATPDQDMNDWGAAGPASGPLSYVHTTYGSEVKIRGTKTVLESFSPSGNSFPRRVRRTYHPARQRLPAARRQVLRRLERLHR